MAALTGMHNKCALRVK